MRPRSPPRHEPPARWRCERRARERAGVRPDDGFKPNALPTRQAHVKHVCQTMLGALPPTEFDRLGPASARLPNIAPIRPNLAVSAHIRSDSAELGRHRANDFGPTSAKLGLDSANFSLHSANFGLDSATFDLDSA